MIKYSLCYLDGYANRIRSSPETNARYVVLIICILPKLPGLENAFAPRRGSIYLLMRLLFQETIKRY